MNGSKPLAIEKKEQFAKLVALGYGREKAFVEVGYKPNASHASRLAKNGPVHARIKYLQHEAAKKTVQTLESLIEDGIKIRDLSIELGQMNAAVGALKELGILTGHRVEKREQTHRGVSDLSDAELIELIKASGAQLPTIAPLTIEHEVRQTDPNSDALSNGLESSDDPNTEQTSEGKAISSAEKRDLPEAKKPDISTEAAEKRDLFRACSKP